MTQNMYRSTEEKKFMHPEITGTSSLGMQGMELAARKSSMWHAAVARITRVPSSTTASKLLWSGSGSTEWRKMARVSLLRSGTRHKTQMPRSHQWL